MNLLRVLTISVMTLSITGCYMGRSCMVDPCDACSTGPVIGGGILRFFALPTAGSCCSQVNDCGMDSCNMGGYGDMGGCGGMGGCPIDSGCACGKCSRRPMGSGHLSKIFGRNRCQRKCAGQPCGCGDAMMNGSSGCNSCGSMSPMGGNSFGCGCGQPFPAPTSPSMGAPVPNVLPESSITAPPPPPGNQTPTESGPTSMKPASTTMPTQTVSYEEFQRLPGTITSGPGSPSMPSSNSSIPSLKTSPWSVRQASTMTPPPVPGQNQQAVWVPGIARQ